MRAASPGATNGAACRADGLGYLLGGLRALDPVYKSRILAQRAAKAYVYAVAKACDRGETTREDAAGAHTCVASEGEGESGGDMIVWTSANKAAAFPNMDYLSPSQVKPLVASGALLAPAASQCTLPAEVVKASPTGMVMMIGYGPEAHFSDKPKAPTWTVRGRYKTTASLMLGMGEMMGAAAPGQQQAKQPPRKKKKRFGLGDIIEGATGLPVGQ